MPAGRPAIPTELKKLKGTLNTTREKNNPSADVLIAETSIILPEDTKISVPKTITEKKVKKFFKEVVKNLLTLRVLSIVDIPQIETLCLTYQKFIEVQKQFIDASIFDEDFDLIEKRYERLGKRFDELAAKFYISPSARTQLKLNDLALIKTAQEITKNQSAIGKLLNDRI